MVGQVTAVGLYCLKSVTRMRAPMEAIYGEDFPVLWAAWCQAYRDYYSR